MSSPVYELLKRPDELFVVEHAHLQPRSSRTPSGTRCIDARPYPELDDVDFVFSRQLNLETIHRHDVVAERTGTVGQLRAELQRRRGGPHTELARLAPPPRRVRRRERCAASLNAALGARAQPAQVRAVEEADRSRRSHAEDDHRRRIAEQRSRAPAARCPRRSTRATRSGTQEDNEPDEPGRERDPDRDAEEHAAACRDHLPALREAAGRSAASGRASRRRPHRSRRGDAARRTASRASPARSPSARRAPRPARRASGRRCARRSSRRCSRSPPRRMSSCFTIRTSQYPHGHEPSR